MCCSFVVHKYKYSIYVGTICNYNILCCNPTLRECEDETHTPEMGTCESFGTPKTSELNFKGQNTSS